MFHVFILPIVPPRLVEWCNGNTTEFGSVILGSSPSSTTALMIINVFLKNLVMVILLVVKLGVFTLCTSYVPTNNKKKY